LQGLTRNRELSISRYFKPIRL